MQTDELRAELAELAREVDEFPEQLAAIRHRVARRRALLGSIAIVVAIALVVAVVTVRKSNPSRIHIAGIAKEVATAKLTRLDAVVVLPRNSTDADAGQLRATLDSIGAVEEYASFRPAIVAGVLGFAVQGINSNTALRARVCRDAATRSYGVELSRKVPKALRGLIAAVGTTATVQPIGKQGVDIEVFMDVGAPSAQIDAVRARIESDPDVIKYTLIDHEKALQEFRRLFAGNPNLIAATPASSLPESFRLVVRHGASVPAVASRFERLPGVGSAGTQSTELWTNPAPEHASGLSEVFMKVDATKADIAGVRTALANDPAVESFRFLTKADAYAEFKQLFADEPQLIAGADPSALPASFRVTLKDADSATDFARRYRSLAGVTVVNISRGALTDACTPTP
ncbi:MAG TPA: permease-like cell division protein FtsX [Acidimicrobiia bacterium]|jgi:cell division protein FtsX|nr:permease-like cell division protein FtsX [Acidimicrobiia bacterium]